MSDKTVIINIMSDKIVESDNKDVLIANLLNLKALLVTIYNKYIGNEKVIKEYESKLKLLKSEEGLYDQNRAKLTKIKNEQVLKDDENIVYLISKIKEYEESFDAIKKTTTAKEKFSVAEELKKLKETSSENELNLILSLEAVKKHYSHLIKHSDFKGIDYIIYALDSGRSDTIKEALNFLTEEERHARLVSTIEGATKHLAGTINQLGDRVEQSLNVVASKLDNINYSINEASKEANKMAEKISSAISISSHQLMGKIDSLRNQYLLGRTLNII